MSIALSESWHTATPDVTKRTANSRDSKTTKVIAMLPLSHSARLQTREHDSKCKP